MGWNFLRGDEKAGGGVFGFLRKNVVEPTVNPVFKFLNTASALPQVLTGNEKAAKRTLSPGGGLGHQGGVLGGEELSGEAVLFKPRNVKKVAGTGLSIGSNLVAPGLGGATAKLGTKIVRGGLTGAGISSVSGVGEQLASGNPLNPAELGVDALFGATFGGVTPAFSRSLRPGEFKKLTKANTPEEARNVLKNKLPDDVVKQVAPAIAQTKDPNIIDNIVRRATTPPEVASATVPTPVAPPPTNPFDQITDALNGRQGIAAVSAKNKAALSQERGQRFAASKAAGETADGSQGYFQELSQLKGTYSKTKLGGMVENLGPEQAEDLFSQARKQIQSVPDQVYDDLGYFPQSARLNTQKAIRKVIFGEGGGVPTESELKLIRLVSPSLADDVASKIPKQRKFFDLVAKLAGLPRALQASLDLSMGGRQGLLVAARHPILWARANKESVKYLGKPKYFDQQMSALRKTPEYALGEKYGLATPAANKGAEEAYASADLALKIPGVGKGVEASQRAYDGGLTKLRSDLWAQTLKSYGGVDLAEKNLGAKGMQDLAEAINTLTGRGGKKGGWTEEHVKTLSTTLFAPRLWLARLNTLNPVYYARLSPAARKVALENAAAFAGVASVVLGAAAALGAEIETDARSSDFLKIKFGDTRYDPFGGLQQNMVFAWRQITGEKKSSITGDVTKFGRDPLEVLSGKSKEEAGVDEGFGVKTRLGVASDIAANKLAPVPAFAARALEGKDRGGQDLNYTSLNPLENEIGKLFVPINLQGIYEASKSTGSITEAAARNVPNLFGVGTQTYGIQDINLSDKQEAQIKLLEQEGAPKEQVVATKSFYQHLKSVPNRNKVSKQINDALAAGDTDKAVQLAKDYNQEYAKRFKPWAKKYGQYAEDEALLKEYTAGKIRMTGSDIKRRLRAIEENPLYQVKE